jgi:hypothetical protein
MGAMQMNYQPPPTTPDALAAALEAQRAMFEEQMRFLQQQQPRPTAAVAQATGGGQQGATGQAVKPAAAAVDDGADDVPWSGLEDLRTLLRAAKVPEDYLVAFKQFGVDSRDDLRQLTEKDWDDLDVKPFHKRKILSALE